MSFPRNIMNQWPIKIRSADSIVDCVGGHGGGTQMRQQNEMTILKCFAWVSVNATWRANDWNWLFWMCGNCLPVWPPTNVRRIYEKSLRRSWTQLFFKMEIYLWNAVANWNTIRAYWESRRLRSLFLLSPRTFDRHRDFHCCMSPNHLWILSWRREKQKLFQMTQCRSVGPTKMAMAVGNYFHFRSSLSSTLSPFSALPSHRCHCWRHSLHPDGFSFEFSSPWPVDFETKPVIDGASM